MASNRQHFGYAVLSDPDGIRENDTFTCNHCSCVVHIPPRTANKPMPGGACAACGHKLICDKCVDIGTCTPFLKKIEQQEQRARLLALV